VRTILFFVPDNMDVVIDRRILDQVRYLQKLGDRVYVAAYGNQARLFELAGAPTILISQLQSNLKKHQKQNHLKHFISQLQLYVRQHIFLK